MGITNRFTSEEYVEEKLADLEASLSSIQSDWNQNDENAVDYIKNRPFYSTGEYENKELLKDFKPTALGSGVYILKTCPVLIEGQTYQVILNNEEFICVGRINDEGSVALGNINYKTDGWTDEHEPFSLSSLGGMGILDVDDETASTECIISISESTEKIQPLDKKYIVDYLVGEKTEGKEFVYEDKTYTGGAGAEIFNSPANKAIGSYSHAEGTDTVALGDNSHAEGTSTKALADESHAEGSTSYAEGNSSHAEGYFTQASGMSSHSEGIRTIASGDYSHAEGENTVANSQSSHVQGKFNVLDNLPKYTHAYFIMNNIQHNGEESIYILNSTPVLNTEVGTFDAEITETQVKNLKTNDLVIFSNQKPFNTYYNITEIQSDDNSQYQLTLTGITTQINRGLGTYAHIIGNGTSEENRSNAHTLDWNGNAWYQGDVYVGSTSGVNRDKGSKKLATEDFVSEQINQLSQEKVDQAYVDDEIEELNKKIVQETGKLSQENAELKSDLINRAVSVISFGAVPDGKTDCVEAFRKAFEFSSCVFVPEGNYYISGDITLPDNAHFYGINPLKSHIFLNSVGGAFKFNGSSVLNGGTHKSFLNIHDLTIERKNSDDITTEPSLDISYSGFVSLRNVHFIKGKQQVSGWEVFDSVFTECKFMNSDYTSDLAAVRLSSGGGYAERTNNITFNNCIWESFCGKAIYINSVANDDNIRANKLYFNNCKFESKFIETGVIPIFIIGLDCLFMKNIFCCVNKGNAYNGIIYINGDINEAIFSNIQFDYEWTSKAEQEYMNPIRFVYGLARYVNIDMFFYNANDIYNPTDDNLYVDGNIVNKRVIANGYSNY